ncbi:M14 family zinc carboxypeptidase [Plantactinospora sp. KLBMP9567]|uniref:M14 family zinc carboxypeptidase n=1 Tax=Plantactinospora sp. KLBMP9567 TaxID=3085900 RepID=UPI0029824EC9|nr:M14 family zinc carboxypeptidase [Plantactinospora sp. KLBMP9567]
MSSRLSRHSSQPAATRSVAGGAAASSSGPDAAVSPLKRRLAVAAALLVGVPGAVAMTSGPVAAQPLQSHCGTETGNKPVEGFISHDELRRSLAQIEQTSGGKVAVDVAGHSNQGREIWTARVGEGDTVVLIQSQIHGNEMNGTVALLETLKKLGDNSARSAEIRKAVTVVAVPRLNADGGELDTRQNATSWDDVVADFPQLAGVQPAWNYNSRLGGFDVNRDFNPDLDYVPQPGDFPGNSASVGWYVTHEAQTVREVYRGLEREFGTVDVFVDLHNQAPCYTGEGMDDFTTLSISGRFITDPAQHGNWPKFDYDASRRINVAAYDAMQGGNSPQSKVTRYPQDTNLPGTALGSFALRGSATILFETRGQTQSWSQKQNGMLNKQIEVGMFGIIDAVADGTLAGIDPERYESIPERMNVPQD